jgi:hypothetical protein
MRSACAHNWRVTRVFSAVQSHQKSPAEAGLSEYIVDVDDLLLSRLTWLLVAVLATLAGVLALLAGLLIVSALLLAALARLLLAGLLILAALLATLVLLSTLVRIAH